MRRRIACKWGHLGLASLLLAVAHSIPHAKDKSNSLHMIVIIVAQATRFYHI